MKIGDAVVYVDSHGNAHNALLTQVWGEQRASRATLNPDGSIDITALESGDTVFVTPEGKYVDAEDGTGTKHMISIYYPAVNLVYVNSDENYKDQYGRQIVRETSVVHKGQQSAHGRYYYVNR
jgi:hypothetical protein